MQTPVTGQQGHQPDTHDQPHDHQHSHDHDDLEYGDIHEHSAGLVEYIRLALLAAVIIASLTGWWKGVISRDWLAFAATLIGGFPIFAEAWENLRKRRMTMELSMTIALIGALCIGQFLTALVIAFFVLFAELVEGYTVGSGRRAIEKLINALPRTVTVRRDGVEREVDANEIKSGETIIIRPGERIPADGVVSKGHSFVDQASITGEPMAVEKFEASKVFAGTINNDGVLEVRAERIGRDTTFGKIIEIVEQAEKSKAPVQRIADKLAAGLVYFALGAAVLTFIVTRNVTSTIAVVIVAGACGVAAGTPLAILAGIGRAARRGIVIKGGLYLEQLSRIDTVVLDKTGTLTLGVPEVTCIRIHNGATEDEVLQTAAMVEQHSEHPLGEAIVRRARERNLALRDYNSIAYSPGKGLVCEANGSRILVGTRGLLEEHRVTVPFDFASGSLSAAGETTVLIARNQEMLGSISLADQLRAEAKQAVIELNHLGLRTILLTGDSSETASVVGNALGVHEAVGDLLPRQKLEKVRELLKNHHKVVMVGDGVNDAPALAEATVGVAMGQGTDVALETADVTLMTSDLSRLVEVLTISKRCYGVIMFNFWGTIAVDTAGIILAFFGLLAPIFAALVHVGSELAFILNSARLFRQRSTTA
ncbi:MAG TPA: cation-translocating P-type ATPase [Candidatus Udaeobacter sp.]|nr:cation-translocating P-type ATPase [Candidatus Udaeobacter sp.]